MRRTPNASRNRKAVGPCAASVSQLHISSGLWRQTSLANKNRMSVIASFNEFSARVHDFVRSAMVEPGDANQRLFDGLALELFALQFEHNLVYRKFCEARGISPQIIEHWTQIPAVPTAAFKEVELSCLPVTERASVFYSSGTTEHRPSRHFHNADSLGLYEVALLAWFSDRVLADSQWSIASIQTPAPDGLAIDCWRLAILTPQPAQAPHSSLVHMFDTIRRAMGAPGSAFLSRVGTDGGWTLDLESTVAA